MARTRTLRLDGRPLRNYCLLAAWTNWSAIRGSEFERGPCGVMLFSRKNFQLTIQPTAGDLLCDFQRLTRLLAVPAVLYVVVKPLTGPLSRQRSRVRVSSSPPFFQAHTRMAFPPKLSLCRSLCRNSPLYTLMHRAPSASPQFERESNVRASVVTRDRLRQFDPSPGNY
jgi:hypothetical protein